MEHSVETTDLTPVPTTRFRRTRIFVSMFFAFLAVAFAVLWVRSYWNFDVIRRTGIDSKFDVSSQCGSIHVSYIPEFRKMPAVWWQWLRFDTVPTFRRPRILYSRSSDEIRLELPHFLLPAVSGLLAASVWMPNRFSLRTLLIATTLIAVVLGLAVWAGR